MPTRTARIWATLWALQYATRLLWKYRGDWKAAAHHANIEHAHLMDQAEARAVDPNT